MAPPRHHASTALRIVALALGGCALSTTGAAAGTVSVKSTATPMPGETLPEWVSFNAPGSERNTVGVTSTDVTGTSGKAQLRWTVKDSATPLTAGAGCQQVDAQTATCIVAGDRAATVQLGAADDDLVSDAPVVVAAGDGDDTIRLSGDLGSSSGEVHGGNGDDLIDASLAKRVRLVGDDGGDLLIGSDLPDRLDGGRGTDELRGGDGNDQLSPGGDPDKITCGAGSDDAVTLDRSDRLLDPDTPTLALPATTPAPALGGAFAFAARAPTAASAQTSSEHAELKTDCELLALPSGRGRHTRIDLSRGGEQLRAGVLSLGRRTGPARAYDVQLRDLAGTNFGRGSLRARTVRIRLSTAGLAALQPGSRWTVRLLTVREGTKGLGKQSGPGVQVDLTIGD